MKRRSLVSALAIITLLAGALMAHGQQISQSTLTLYPSNQAGAALTSSYASWRVQSLTAVSAGSGSITLNTCFVGVGSNNRFAPFSSIFNLNTPLTIIDGANTETVTPTATQSPTPAAPSAVNPLQCGFTATFANSHSVGVTIASGDYGFMEAVNDSVALGSDYVIVDNYSGVVTSTITGATTTAAGGIIPNVIVEYRRAAGATNQPLYFGLRPTTLTLISAPSAPTVTGTSGSLTSGTYYGKVAYVDCLGGVSLASSDSTQVATTTGLIFTSPAATAGACGYLPYMTANGGSTGTEILAAASVTSSICTLTTLETVLPACAIGSSATVTAANPSSTAKPVAEGTAHTTFGFQPFSTPPLNFQTTYGPFGTVSTISSSSNSDLAQFYIPAGYFNYLGKGANICFTAASTNGATAVPTWNLNVTNQYGQTIGTVSSVTLATQTGAVTTTGCFKIVVAATGSSGTFWPGGSIVEAINSSSAAVAGVPVTTAVQPASNAPSLASGLWFSVNLAAGTANITSATVNQLTIEPITNN